MAQSIQHIINLIPGGQGRNAVITPLEGGITNSNYRVDVHGSSYVVRVFGMNFQELGIVRAHEYHCTRIASDLGIGPEVIQFLPDQGALITRFIEVDKNTAACVNITDTLQRIVGTIKQYHQGPSFPGHFSPFQAVRDYHKRAISRQVRFPDDLSQSLSLMDQIEQALISVQRVVPCHNDLLPDNMLHAGDRIWILDWEYAAMGDLFFDLGNFAVNHELTDDQKTQMLHYYFGEVRSSDLSHLHLMCLASDLREAFWGYLQSGLSTLDFDYMEYGQKHLDRFLTIGQSPAFKLWVEEVDTKN